MMARTLAAVAREVQGRLVGADQPFGSVTTDTRALAAGSLFVAIPGDRFDGNDFVEEAFTKGAAGALRIAPRLVGVGADQKSATLAALGAMARAWRASFTIPLVAVTGSSGKTTVKELIAAILGVSRSVCVTQGNLNNDIGVPLTLMRLTAEHDVGVIELGANHAGEIDYLASLAQPTVGVITKPRRRISKVRSVLASQSRRRLLDLPRAGTAVRTPTTVPQRLGPLSRCDTVTLAPRRATVALGEPHFLAKGSEFRMHLPDGERRTFGCCWAQNVANALASLRRASVGTSVDDIVAESLAAARPDLRLRVLAGPNGSTIIDDSYNANPLGCGLDHLGRSRASASSCSATWPSSARLVRPCTRRSVNTRAAVATRCSRSARWPAKPRKHSARKAAPSLTSKQPARRSIRCSRAT
jgi:UDP-N-acetylmuramoyl-tripeptide--D-alanyl-D-alanine ligase